jgi:TonB-linked SusC/RagA family outer membrane protein
MNLRKLLYWIGLPMLLILSVVGYAQDKTVSGRVMDAAGKGIPFVSVTVKGQTSKVVTTKEDGSFSLNVPASATTLVLSSVGYLSQEVTIAGKSTVDITLQSSAGNLNEVVVIGYGTARKRDVTGAVAVVGTKDFVKGPITSAEQLIAGKVAGVQISPNGGAPGAGSRIRIRGGASLNASNDPLIVIDGVPVDGGVAGSANPLNMINPNDIESFTVLKDPSAAAIYGSRASNGVILITTKKGRKGAVKFNFSTNVFLQTPTKTVDVLTADQIRQIVKTQGSTEESKRLGQASTDWQDQIYHNALGQDYNLSASGALINGKLPFRISGGYLNQDGILRTSNFKRQSLAINLSPSFLNDQLKVNVNLKGARTTNHFADEGGAIGGATAFDPTQPITVNSKRFGGYFEYVDSNSFGAPPRDLAPRNPVSILNMTDNNSEVYRSLGNIAFDYAIPFIKGLHANLNLGYDVQSGKGTNVTTDSAGSGYRRWELGKTANNKDTVLNFGGVNNEYKSEQRNLLMDFYLNYVTELKNIHSRVDVTAGTGYQDFRFTSYNFADYRYNKTMRPGTKPVFDNNISEYTLISYYGRLNYTLANKYVLTLNARMDGTSKFNPDERWGFFPSAAFAWRMNEESFLRNSKTVSDLKLRIGYGITGQQAGISFYGYIPRYSQSNEAAQYQFGNTFYSLYRPNAYDPNLKWETTKNLNLAVDFGFLQNRITGSVDYFIRKTEDLLSVVPIPLGTNFSNQLLTNVGNIESKGVEVTLNTIPVQSRKVTWELGANFTYIDPEITKLLLNPDPSFKGNRIGGISGGTGNTIQVHSVGYRPGAFFVYQQIYDKNGKPIEGLYEDINRDGVINDNDLYRYKSPDPRFLLGVSSGVTVGKWSGGFTLRGSFDNYVYNNVESNLGVKRAIFNPLGWLNNGTSSYLETNFENNQYFSDYYVENASFVRMDNINIGYNAGEVFKKTTLRVGLNVQNAFVITNYTGIDPEINGGINNSYYPRARTYTLAVNLDF